MKEVEVTMKIDGRRKGITRTFPVPEGWEDNPTREHAVGLAIYRLLRDEITPEFLFVHRTQTGHVSWVYEGDDSEELEEDYIRTKKERNL